MNKHLDIKIFGHVQGLGFRWSAQQEATKLGLVGLVRNEKDASVYVEVEGEEANVAKFLNWCQKGPLFAKVEEIEVEQSGLKSYNTFEIKL